MRSLQDDDPWSVSFEEDRVRNDLETLISTPHFGQVWLLADAPDRPPIGYLVLCFDYSLEYGGRGAWIDEVFIDRRRRGEGLGTETLRFAEEAAREAGAKVLHLEVNRGNRALELYRRSGFQDHDRYLLSKWL
jgi:GNAT superfamily N-acetyltransferase